MGARKDSPFGNKPRSSRMLMTTYQFGIRKRDNFAPGRSSLTFHYVMTDMDTNIFGLLFIGQFIYFENIFGRKCCRSIDSSIYWLSPKCFETSGIPHILSPMFSFP